ncbi:uncharacterized protein LOC143063508 [Mytilus galloprovincialis]|uniref:uncharacterized protein LOC143063508 n=1 Tax=Mytilus galloprovincialis TaxID=29158 RepID=UPI003F7B76C8
MMFRILLVVSTIFGFILCFLSIVLPYWVIFETATYSGQIGVFLICINQHEDGVSCSRIVKDSYIVDGSYKIPQVFMGLGFSFYLISVFLATMTFFWTRDQKKIRGIKFAAASFAFLTAICLVVTVVVFHSIHDKETETITYGWYIAVISLGCVTFACPCYIVDGCQTIKQKNEKVPKTNTAPSPTALTVYQRQKLIDGFNNQMSKQQSQLPEPLYFEDKYAILSDETNIEHHSPKPITTDDSDDDTNELMNMETLKQPMVVPPSSEFSIKKIDDYGCNEDNFVHPPPKIVSSDPSSSEFRFKTIDDYGCNDDNFVHPPPKIVSSDPSSSEFRFKTIDDYGCNDDNFVHPPPKSDSADTPLKDILLKNLQPHSGNGRDISRTFSLESGQTDDSDLDFFLLTKGSRSNKGIDEDRPPSREAFDKRKVVDGKIVTEIPHDELSTTDIFGSDKELSDCKESNHLHESTHALPIEEVVVIQSETSNALPIEEVEVIQSETSNALPIEEVEVIQSETSNALPIEEVEVIQSETSNALPIEKEVVIQSEAVNDNDTQYTAKSAPKRSSRRYKSEHNNEHYAKSNNTIFRAQYGTSSPYTKKPDLPRKKGKYDDKRQKPEKRSSKRTKQNTTQHDKTKRMLGNSRVGHNDSNAAKEEIPNEATVKGMFGYSNGDGVFTQFLKENATSSDLVADTFDEKHKNEIQHGEQSEKQADNSVSFKDLNTIKEEIPTEAKTNSVVGRRDFLY